MKKPLVTNLEDCKWPSYRAYIDKDKNIKWLSRQFIYDILGAQTKIQSLRIIRRSRC